jgi:hypothetical protein
MIEIIKNKIGELRLAELKKENDKTARLGLDEIWALSEKHPFHKAGVDHDLAYLVCYDLLRMGEKKLAKNYSLQADKIFIKEINKIAKNKKSNWLKFQARLFAVLVNSYNKIRF